MNAALAEVGKARKKAMIQNANSEMTMNGDEKNADRELDPSERGPIPVLGSPPRMAPHTLNSFEQDFFSPAKRDLTRFPEDRPLPFDHDKGFGNHDGADYLEDTGAALLNVDESAHHDVSSYEENVESSVTAVDEPRNDPNQDDDVETISQSIDTPEKDIETANATTRMVETDRQQSLTDRTRISMGLTDDGSEGDISPASATVEEFALPEITDTTSLSEHSSSRSRMSLSDATRQSIAASMALTSQKLRQAKDQQKPRASLYPINQFETPNAKHNTRQTLDKRNVTPLKDLYAQDIDYASVFKSRPKLKTSPTQSPLLERSAWLGHEESDDGDT